MAHTHDSSTCAGQRQNCGEFKSSLGYRVRLQLNTNKQMTKLIGVGTFCSLCPSVCDSTQCCAVWGPAPPAVRGCRSKVSSQPLDLRQLLLLALAVLQEAE